MEKTKDKRTSSKLFISYQKPHNPVSKDTITRWCNEIMKKAGIDVNKYVTHSCRSAASSYASSKGVKLKTILDSCGWSSSRTFAAHYRKDIVCTRTMDEHLLRSWFVLLWKWTFGVIHGIDYSIQCYRYFHTFVDQMIIEDWNIYISYLLILA